jgi:hypothetical protein
LSGARPSTRAERIAAAEQRPRRPVLIEIAAAVLVIGGVVSILTSIEAMSQLARQGTPIDTIAGLSLAIGAGILLLGLFVRSGRGWLVALNVVAVIAFLELLSGTIVGLVFGLLDLGVVLALVWERAWFYWTPPTGRDANAEAE